MIGLWRGVRNRYGHYITLAFSFQLSMEVFVLDHGVVKRGASKYLEQQIKCGFY